MQTPHQNSTLKEGWYLVFLLLLLAIVAGFSHMSHTSAFIANIPPQWEYPTTVFTTDKTVELPLSHAFFDPDSDPISFAISPGIGVTAGIYDDVLVVAAGSKGNLTITASDGKEISQKILLFNPPILTQ